MDNDITKMFKGVQQQMPDLGCDLVPFCDGQPGIHCDIEFHAKPMANSSCPGLSDGFHSFHMPCRMNDLIQKPRFNAIEQACENRFPGLPYDKEYGDGDSDSNKRIRKRIPEPYTDCA